MQIDQRAALPAQGERGHRLVTVDREDHLLDEELAEAPCGRGVRSSAHPRPWRGSAPRAQQAITLLLTEDMRGVAPGGGRVRPSRPQGPPELLPSRARARGRRAGCPGRPPCNDARRGWLHSSRARRPGRHCLSAASLSASRRSAAAMVAASLAGSSAAREGLFERLVDLQCRRRGNNSRGPRR